MNRISIARSISVLLVLLVTGGQRADADDGAAQRMQNLIERLGDPEFSVREQAGERLLDIGAPAIPALERAANHPDREIRFRAQRLISLVRKFEFQRRLRTFAHEQPGEEDFELPGWRRVREVIGDTANSRALYVEMVRAETELFQKIESNPPAAVHSLEARIVQLRQDQTIATEPLPFAPVAAVIFMATQRDLTFGDDLVDQLLPLCHEPGFHKAITESSYREPLRIMLGSVIEQANVWSCLQAVPLALAYDIKEVVTPAAQVLALPVEQTEVDLRRLAILAVARFGDRSHTELLEKCLEDHSPVVSQAVAIHRGYETQLRDIALAALWKLHGEDPQQHGFSDHVQADAQSVFQTATLGFTNNEQRQSALAEWREYRATSQQPKQQQ